MEIVMTFGSTTAAIGAESALLAAGLPVKVMNLPGGIRAGCGICLRLPPTDMPAARPILERAGCPWEELYPKTSGQGQTTYKPWKEGL